MSVNHVDAWEVTDANKIVRICNPTAASIDYELYLFGTSTPAPGGSGSGG